MDQNNTPFSLVYDSFLSKITDDMYMELTEFDTFKLLEELLNSAIHAFEFPRVLLDYEPIYYDVVEYAGAESDFKEVEATVLCGGFFYNTLTNEEINIIATYMVVEWIGQQLASVENARMKYSGSDFKFTSQANHMQKLQALKASYTEEGFHLQRLYKRRKINDKGVVCSTFGSIMAPIEE